MKDKIIILVVLIILCLLPTLVTSSSYDTFTVVVKINITANFTYQPQYPSQGGAVTFTDTSSPNIAINWSWNFGDASISYQENPAHTYYYAGTYQVNLMVVNAGGVNDTISKNITVSSGGGGRGPSPPPSPPPDEEEEGEGTTTSEDILEDIEEQYDIDLEDPFYANDTTGDGTVDTFTDPNGVLTSLHNTTIDENASFLISVNSDLDKLFIWDTEADTITQVTHSIGTITDTVTDADEDTITVTVTIEKTNWTYIEVGDEYPEFSITIKTADGRVISSDMIWRENGKIYLLDDPAVEYLFIYSYEGFLFDVLLELTTDSVYIGESINALVTLINVGEPGLVNGTVTYTRYKENVVVWTAEENVSVLGQKAFNKTISTEGLTPGEYTFEVVYSYGDNQTANAQGMFTVNAQPQPPSEEILLWIFIVLVVILIIILIIVFLFKTGYFYIETEEEKEGQKDEKNTIAKIKSKLLKWKKNSASLLSCPSKFLSFMKRFFGKRW